MFSRITISEILTVLGLAGLSSNLITWQCYIEKYAVRNYVDFRNFLFGWLPIPHWLTDFTVVLTLFMVSGALAISAAARRYSIKPGEVWVDKNIGEFALDAQSRFFNSPLTRTWSGLQIMLTGSVRPIPLFLYSPGIKLGLYDEHGNQHDVLVASLRKYCSFVRPAAWNALARILFLFVVAALIFSSVGAKLLGLPIPFDCPV